MSPLLLALALDSQSVETKLQFEGIVRQNKLFYVSTVLKGHKKNQGTSGLKLTAPIGGFWCKARIYQSFDLTKVYEVQPLNFIMEVRVERDF